MEGGVAGLEVYDGVFELFDCGEWVPGEHGEDFALLVCGQGAAFVLVALMEFEPPVVEVSSAGEAFGDGGVSCVRNVFLFRNYRDCSTRPFGAFSEASAFSVEVINVVSSAEPTVMIFDGQLGEPALPI